MAESNTQAQKEPRLPIGYWLKRADQVLTARINETQQVNGLTRIEWQLLNVLHEITLATREQLAAPLRPFVDGVALDDVVRRLDQRGLIEGDGSATSPCRLTTPGQELHRAALSQQKEVRQQAVKGISEADYAIAVRVLQRLVENLDESHEHVKGRS